MQYTNVPAVHVKGVEGEIRYDWQGRLQLSTNVSYQDTRDQQKYKGDGKPSATYNNRVPNRPWLFGSVEAYYTFRNIAPARKQTAPGLYLSVGALVLFDLGSLRLV